MHGLVLYSHLQRSSYSPVRQHFPSSTPPNVAPEAPLRKNYAKNVLSGNASHDCTDHDPFAGKLRRRDGHIWYRRNWRRRNRWRWWDRRRGWWYYKSATKRSVERLPYLEGRYFEKRELFERNHAHHDKRQCQPIRQAKQLSGGWPASGATSLYIESRYGGFGYT